MHTTTTTHVNCYYHMGSAEHRNLAAIAIECTRGRYGDQEARVVLDFNDLGRIEFMADEPYRFWEFVTDGFMAEQPVISYDSELSGLLRISVVDPVGSPRGNLVRYELIAPTALPGAKLLFPSANWSALMRATLPDWREGLENPEAA